MGAIQPVPLLLPLLLLLPPVSLVSAVSEPEPLELVEPLELPELPPVDEGSRPEVALELQAPREASTSEPSRWQQPSD